MYVYALTFPKKWGSGEEVNNQRHYKHQNGELTDIMDFLQKNEVGNRWGTGGEQVGEVVEKVLECEVVRSETHKKNPISPSSFIQVSSVLDTRTAFS